MSTAEYSERRRMRKYFLQRTRYGPEYRAAKRMYRPLVDAGVMNCARCSELIEGEWDLGHDDYTGEIWGPEHMKCNRGAPNKNKTSREW